MPEQAGSWSVTNLGNACVLLRIGDAVILTDPYFGDSPGISDAAGLDRNAIPELTAILGSHWAQDHWEIESFAHYPWREQTPVYVSDPSMADRAATVGFSRVETLKWGDRRHLTGPVELEVVPEHRSADGMLTNNYAISSPSGRIFFGGEVLDVDRVERYARTAPPFDAAIGPVNGARFRGRQLVTTADEMATVARALGASTLIPIHDGHLPFEGLVEITSSRHDLDTFPAGGLTVVDLEPGETHSAPGTG